MTTGTRPEIDATLPPVLLHLHVPRSSGSSLHGWFLNCLGEKSVVQANSAATLQAGLAGRGAQTPVVASGHFSFGIHAALEGHPHRYAVLLREPVARVLSLFRYIRSLPTHRDHAVLNEPGMTIARFYASQASGRGGYVFGSWSRDGTVAQLAGVMGSGTTPTEEHLERARANLLDPATMFATVDDPGPLLRQAAAFLRIGNPPKLPKANQLSAAAAREHWGGSEEDIAAITAANRLDIALHRQAIAHLARSLPDLPAARPGLHQVLRRVLRRSG